MAAAAGLAVVAAAASVVAPLARSARPPTPPATAAGPARLPMSFEANQGQAGPDVRFVARGPGYRLFVTDAEAVVDLGVPSPPGERAVVRMALAGAIPSAPVGAERLAGVSNYFLGDDPSRWHTGVAHFGRVVRPGVYPGVDLVYRAGGAAVEYDFVVAPGADPSVIALAFEGHDRLRLDAGGDLVLRTPAGELRHRRPLTYQDTPSGRRVVPSRFVLRGERVGFAVGPHDRGRPLVIDPAVTYATFLGGGGDDAGWAVGADAGGHAYLAGSTNSLDFPRPGGRQTLGGAPGVDAENLDAFVVKLNPEGTDQVWATYFGGTRARVGSGGRRDIALDIAVAGTGEAYVAGSTEATDFPVTAGALRTATAPGMEGFVVKLTAGGGLAYATYLGGNSLGNEWAQAIAVDGAGDAYIAGFTQSADFPTTPDSYQPVRSIAGHPSIFFDTDAFVVKLRPAGAGPADLLYGTYLGGWWADYGSGIAIDDAGRVYVAGSTQTRDRPDVPAPSEPFPTTPTAVRRPGPDETIDAFVSVLDPSRPGPSALVYSTLVGGSSGDSGSDVAADPSGGAVYVTGYTGSDDMATTPGAFQEVRGGDTAFVAKLDPGAAGPAGLVYATFLGEADSNPEFPTGSIAVDGSGTAYVTDLGRLRKLRFAATGPGDLLDELELKARPADVALDPAGGVYVAGSEAGVAPSGDPIAIDFETTPGVVQPSYGGGVRDAVAVRIAAPPRPAPPGLSIAGATVVEGNQGSVDAEFRVVLTTAPARTVTVAYATSDGSATAGEDYVAAAGTLSFPPGVTVQTVAVAVAGDTAVEADETFSVSLSAPVNATIATGQALGTIVNDDAPDVDPGTETGTDPAHGPGNSEEPASPVQAEPPPQPAPAPSPAVQPAPAPSPAVQPAPAPQPQVQAQPVTQPQVAPQAQPALVADRQRQAGLARARSARRGGPPGAHLASAHRPSLAVPAVALGSMGTLLVLGLGLAPPRPRPAGVVPRRPPRRRSTGGSG